MEITVVLHNIRSVYNVGAILRTCEGLGINRVACSGYTPRYDDENLLPHLREKLNRQIEKSALGAEKLVPQVNLGNDEKGLLEFLRECRGNGCRIVGLENNLNNDERERRLILGEKAELGKRVVLILGEEVHGIPAEVRGECEYFLEIPMRGQKESFNVSVATGIALWGLSNLY